MTFAAEEQPVAGFDGINPEKLPSWFVGVLENDMGGYIFRDGFGSKWPSSDRSRP